MALSGDLTEFRLAEVLQILSLGRKTGVLSLSGDRTRGTIVLSAGRLINATTDDLLGEAAFLELAGNREGTFTFVPVAESELHVSDAPPLRSLQTLLMEASERAGRLSRPCSLSCRGPGTK